MNKSIKKHRSTGFGVIDGTKLLLSAVFIALVIIPLIIMFTNIDPESIKNVVNTPNFWEIVLNSLKVGVIATGISVIAAYFLARFVYRSGVAHKDLFSILFTLPMLVPSISLGMGLIILFGNNGIITKLLGQSSGIYGMWGIIMGSVLYSLPVAFLMFADIMKYEDASPYEAAEVLGISKFRQFLTITLPYLKKPLISVIFATFTLIVTDYGVPMAIGGGFKTIPQVMYEEVSGMQFGRGAVWGALLLIPAVIAFIIDLINKDRGNSGFITKSFEESKSKIEKAIAYTVCIVASVFTVSPAISFIFLAFTEGYPNKLSFTFENITDVVSKSSEYLINSVVMALCVALFGSIVAFLTAYLSARMKSKTSKFLHMSSITSAAIPGLVLGLAYAMTFAGTPVYNTMLILVMVNTVHFISSPYLMMYNSLSKINGNLESVGDTLGISRVRMLKDVFLPQSITTLLEMFSYFFVNCMMTISAVSFLSSTSTKPLSLLINQYQTLSKPELAAVVSLIIFGVNLGVKGVFRIIKTRKK
ncbi:MAG: ABC transporter permease subunit [Ruminococcaceae bacterium]|nr:ABC transporter permease subunit [Oscillospiraceae bacterium]